MDLDDLDLNLLRVFHRLMKALGPWREHKEST
jgi:hypothetical protein